MITTTLMKHRKLIAAIVVISLIAIYFTAATSNGWTEGAPEASIVCNIKAVTGDTLTGSASIGDSTVIGQMVPLTSFTSNIDTLDANTQYTISFGATMSTKTAKFGEALTNTISVTGVAGGSKAGLSYMDSTGEASSSASVAGTAGGSSTLSIPGFVKHDYTPSAINIMGDVIDGSVFTFSITSTAPDGRVSSTTATLTITVTSGGTIYISVDSITATVHDTRFYDGWDDVNHPEYIYMTISGTGSYTVDYKRVDGALFSWTTDGTSSMNSWLGGELSKGRLTQRQHDCGVAQAEALA